MKITEARVIVTCPSRNYVLVKLHTDEGLYGVGDITLNGRELATARLFEEHVAPLLPGRDPDAVEDIWQYLSRGSYWRGGPVQATVVAGVDMALWDLKGKRAGLPVYSLLGGKTRRAALAYTHCGGADFQEVEESCRRALENGSQAVRVQCAVPGLPGGVYGQGGGPEAAAATWSPVGGLPAVELWEPEPYLSMVPRLLSHLRESLGPSLKLLHDVHGRLTPIQAARLAREVEPYRLFFLEDPLRPEHRESLRVVRRASTTPLAMGELYTSRWDCLLPVTEQLIDFVRCDLAHCGGITEARKIAALAEPFGVQTAWHGPGDISPVAHAANVHVDLAVPNFGIQEMVFFPEVVREVISGGPEYRDGCLWAAERPGLGVEIDEKKAARHPYRPAYLPVARRADGSVHDW